MNLSDLLDRPSNWSSQYSEVTEVDIPVTDSEYWSVKLKLNGRPLDNLTRVTRIQNPYIYKRYMLRKLEYESLGIPFSETYLLHATAQCNVPSIIRDNLDWRMANRVKFGRGVSFSPSAAYANKECSRQNGYNRAIIVCKVLVGKKYPGNCYNKVPPSGYDTTYGNGINVCVKYYDDEFYPAYVAYYHQ